MKSSDYILAEMIDNILKWDTSFVFTPSWIEIHQNNSEVTLNMHSQLIIFDVISIMEYNGTNVACFFWQNYWICITFTAILKYDHSYKIVECYASLCKHIILIKHRNREDSKGSFELLMVKIYQLFIKLLYLLWFFFTEMH